MILIVDDEPSALLLLEMVLWLDNYVVRKATSGKEALRLLDRDGEERCNLVITDIRMPEMDGRELVARLRAHHRLATIPVVMCTSTADRSTVVELIGQGVCDYIVKPFKAAMVLSKVRGVIADEETVIESRAQTTQRLEIDPLEYAPLAKATMPTLDHIADDLVAALHVRNAKAARAAAERVREPASLFGANRAIAAANGVLVAVGESDLLRCAGILVTEIGELRSALQRVGLARRV